MKITQVTNETEYELALLRLEEIFDAEFGSKEGQEMDALCSLVEAYEKKHYPIE